MTKTPTSRAGKTRKGQATLCVIVSLFLSGCTIGRLDDDRLRIIPASEIHRMDDKGFPLNLFQDKKHRLTSPNPT